MGLARTEKEATQLMEKDRARVHLLYKIKIQGQEGWRDLLMFLAENDMIELEVK